MGEPNVVEVAHPKSTLAPPHVDVTWRPEHAAEHVEEARQGADTAVLRSAARSLEAACQTRTLSSWWPVEIRPSGATMMALTRPLLERSPLRSPGLTTRERAKETFVVAASAAWPSPSPVPRLGRFV